MAAILALLSLLFTSVVADVSLPNPPVGTVYDTLPDPYLRKPAFTPNFTGPDPPPFFGAQTSTNYPEQIGLFPAVRNGSYLWVRYTFPQKPSSTLGVVYYSTDRMKLNKTATCQPKMYSFLPKTNASYVSGYMYQCLIGPLLPSTRYFYRIRYLGTVFPFVSMPSRGAVTPLKLGLMADVGETSNSSITYTQMAAHDVDMVLFAGDLNYADNYGAYGPCEKAVPGGPDMGEETCGIAGQRWDIWGRMIQKLSAYTPIAYIPGNHELEISPTFNQMTPYIAYTNRVPALLDNHPKFATQYLDSAAYGARSFPARSPEFYSMDVGPVHIMGLASYTTFMKYTQQWYWFNEDVCRYDRAVTPWFIVFMHTPWYNSDRSHYLEGEPLRVWLEPSLYNASCDLVVSGHVHAYERSFPTYDYKYDACAPTYVTVGDGGNVEGVAGPFLEPQPAYSAYRELSFGSAVLEFYNTTTAEYKWYRNTAGVNSGVVGDSFVLTNKNTMPGCGIKKPSFCGSY